MGRRVKAGGNGGGLQGSRLLGLIYGLRAFTLSDTFTSQRSYLVLPFTEIFSSIVLRLQGLVIQEAALTGQPGPGLISYFKTPTFLFLIFQSKNTHSSQLLAKQR